MHALVVAVTLLATTKNAAAQDAGVPATTTSAPAAVAIARGRSAEAGAVPIAWEYHYDRNALRRTLPVPGGFLTLTEAGNLLLFDPELHTVRKEYFGPVPITYLAGDDKTVVAGFADGRIVTVDPATLGFTPMASVQGSVVWIGRRAAGWVVVHDVGGDQADPRRHRPELNVTDLATKKTYDLPKLTPSAFLVDRHDRLWLGEDHGEWGGSACWLDLANGKRHDVTMPGQLDNNVYGFAELAYGRVLAFGGVMHMGLLSSFITRVDSAPATSVWRRSNLGKRGLEQAEADPNQPQLPITHIVPARDGKLLVFSFSDVFRVDAKIRHWQRLARLDLHYSPGRPDAVGSYPAIRQVLPLDRDGAKLLLVTGRDGHVELEGGKTTERALPGQLGLRSPASAIDSRAGFLLFSGIEGQAWSFDGTRWTRFRAPAVRLALLDRINREREPRAWSRVDFKQSPSGRLYAFTEVSWSPGTRGIDTWENGAFVPIDTSHSWRSDYFLTPDDVWTRDRDNRFERLHEGRWQTFAPAASTGASAEQDHPVGNLRLLGGGKPPWIYYDAYANGLATFDPGDGRRGPFIAALPLEWKGGKLKLTDAVMDTDGTVLLGTRTGVFRYDRRTGAIAPTGFAPEGEPVPSLARDGRGRLWLAGRKLWLLPKGERRAVVVASPPLYGTGPLRLLGPWARHPEGMTIMVYEHGILFVETAAAPSMR
jgi:hypothetical protein